MQSELKEFLDSIDAPKETTVELVRMFKKIMNERCDAVNELCSMCGKYKTEHLGSCDGCRFLQMKYKN